jgi:hypothetical protein
MRARVLSIILGCWVLFGLATAPAGQQSLGEKVVAFCQEHKGQQVGDGECATLANQALRSASAKGRGNDYPNKGDYTWGTRIFSIEAQESAAPKTEGKSFDIKPGDIVQLRDVKFKGRRPGGTYSMTFSHHTAIVAGVEDGGQVVHIFHQNFGGKKVVMNGTYKLADLKEGWLRFYRPVLKTGSSQK